MKQYIVKQGAQCRLVDTLIGTERPFVTTQDNTFVKGDIVFDPVTWFKDHNEVISEYGFRSGDVRQRARYILVVPMVDVGVTK
jgi:hypothetical protein